MRHAWVEMTLPGLADQWLACLRTNGSCSALLHPHLNCGPAATSRILGGWEEQEDAPAELRTIAVLAPKVIRLNLMRGTRLAATLNGHRLVGNEVVSARGAGEIEPVVVAFEEFLLDGKSECILFEDIDTESSLHRALEEHAARCSGALLHRLLAPQPHWWIDFPKAPENYWKKFSKKGRYNIKSAAKKLEHNVERFTDVDHVPPFLTLAHQVSKQSWQAKRIGLRIKNTTQERDFYERLARIGALRSYVLRSQSRPIAFAVGLQWNGCFSYEEVGYDAAFAEHSPGTVLLFRLLEDLITFNTPRTLDFGLGDAEYKRLFGNRQTLSGPLLFVRNTSKNAAILALNRWSNAADICLRRAVKDSAMLRKLRQLYRH